MSKSYRTDEVKFDSQLESVAHVFMTPAARGFGQIGWNWMEAMLSIDDSDALTRNEKEDVRK